MKYFSFVILLGFLLFSISYVSIPLGNEFLYAQSLRTDLLDYFFFYYTKLGQSGAYILIAGVCALLVNFRYAALFGIGGILVLVMSLILKFIFGHPRPILGWEGFNDSVKVLDSYYPLVYDSFPSGHTISGVILFGLLAYLFTKRWTAIALGTAVWLMAVSRIYLVFHFTKDVAFGLICGLILLFILIKLIDPFLKRFKVLEGRILQKSASEPIT